MAQLSHRLGLLIGLCLVPFITATTWSQAIEPLLEPIRGRISMAAPQCEFFMVKTDRGSSLVHMDDYYGVTVGDEVRGVLYYYGSQGIQIADKTTLRATVEEWGLDDSNAAHIFHRLCQSQSDPPGTFVRPSIAAACSAWREHISELIDQHRIADDMDDEAMSGVVLQFISARNACSLGTYEAGLRMYEAISLGRVQGFLK